MFDPNTGNGHISEGLQHTSQLTSLCELKPMCVCRDTDSVAVSRGHDVFPAPLQRRRQKSLLVILLSGPRPLWVDACVTYPRASDSAPLLFGRSVSWPRWDESHPAAQTRKHEAATGQSRFFVQSPGFDLRWTVRVRRLTVVPHPAMPTMHILNVKHILQLKGNMSGFMPCRVVRHVLKKMDCHTSCAELRWVLAKFQKRPKVFRSNSECIC